jgi:hypothetical protein
MTGLLVFPYCHFLSKADLYAFILETRKMKITPMFVATPPGMFGGIFFIQR